MVCGRGGQVAIVWVEVEIVDELARAFHRSHFLDRQEIETMLAASGQEAWFGHRDYALLLVAVQTGRRLSELTVLLKREAQGQETLVFLSNLLAFGATTQCARFG